MPKIPTSKEEQILKEYKEGQAGRDIAKQVSVCYATVYNVLKRNNIKPRGISQSLEREPKRNFSENLFEKSYILGFAIGDLHILKRWQHIRVECSSTKEAQIFLIDKVFGRYGYSYVHSHEKRRGKILFRIQIYLNQSFLFLLDYSRKEIPEWILIEDNYFYSFLAGYFDAEGCLGKVNPNGNIWRLRISSCDTKVLEQLYKKLTSLNYHPKYRFSQITKGEKDYYELSLCRQREVFYLVNVLVNLSYHKDRIEIFSKFLESKRRCKL